MEYILREIGKNRYQLILDNDTYNSKTGEVYESLLLTIEVNCNSGQYHLKGFLAMLNNQLKLREREIQLKAQQEYQNATTEEE